MRWELTREEQFVGTTTRHPMRVDVKVGARRDGTLTALSLDVLSDTGAYGNHAGGVIHHACHEVLAAYVCPNKQVSGRAVYTHTVPAGAFRGYGLSQTIFALESALDEASNLLSGLAGGAGVVSSPVRDAGVKHVEFVALGADQALAVIVADDGTVENRIMTLSAGVTPSTLVEASNFLNARLRGRPFADARREMARELEAARTELDQTAARLVEVADALVAGGVVPLVVAGYHVLAGWPLRIDQTDLLAQFPVQCGDLVLARLDATAGQHPPRPVREVEPHHQHVIVMVDDQRTNRSADVVAHSFGVSFRPSLNMR